MAETLTSSRPAASKNAYVTLLANVDYLPGVTALLQSLRWSETKADLVVLHTDGLTEDDLKPLEKFECRFICAPLLDVSEGFQERHARGALHKAAPFDKGRKPVFHSPLANFCKLRLWQLVEYETCVFLDADTVVIRNMDKLFGYPEFCAAPNVYETLNDFHRLNSGVFTARPSLETFADMMAKLDVPDMFWRRTDQTFLEAYFPDWQGLPIFFNTLQYVWFNLPELWNWESIYLVHYQYEKPWEPDHPKVDELGPLINLWRACFEGVAKPDLSKWPTPALVK